MFRELQEGLLEAETRRVDRGTWPPVSALAGRRHSTVCPRSHRERRADYDWHLTTNGTFVNYLGLPRRSDAPAWLVLVQEPEPERRPTPRVRTRSTIG